MAPVRRRCRPLRADHTPALAGPGSSAMRIAVVGTGYVGLVTGACLASVGHEVTCQDVDGDKVRVLQSGRLPIYEPGLNELASEQVAAGRLRFVEEYAEAIPGAEAVFIC